jgi:hypothetical protein
MSKTWLFLWLTVTAGLTYVANTAVGLVDLQVFPTGSRIEVVALPEKIENIFLNETPISEGSADLETQLGENFAKDRDSRDEPSVIAINENLLKENEIDSSDNLPDQELVEVETVIDTPLQSSATTTSVIPSPPLKEDVPNEALQDSKELQEIQVEVTIPPPTSSALTLPVPSFVPLELINFDFSNLRVGQNYRDELLKGGNPPYEWQVVEGEIPNGLTVDKEGFLIGKPVESGIFEVSLKASDSTNNNIFITISFNINEYRVISVRGGKITVVISGDSVTFFSALQAEGFSPPNILRSGPLVVDVAFLPLSGDETSWVRCEVATGVICSGD